MRPRDLAELVLLAAIWGSSFLFMRLVAPVFGPVALAALRVAGAALLLLPLLAWRGEAGTLGRHWRPLLVLGLTNSALPFIGFGYAALSINAGLSAIFNAATPLFTALIGWLWLRDRLGPPRWLGLAIGFAGVVGLAWHKAGLQQGAAGHAVLGAIVACLGGAVLYGFAANYARRHAGGIPALALATGSQAAGGLALVVPAALQWPAPMPGAAAWAMVAVLALLCSGAAYILYFRLIARVGPTRAASVTFLVPAFALAWGWALLGKTPTPAMLGGCAAIVAGTALTLTLGLWPRPRAAAAAT